MPTQPIRPAASSTAPPVAHAHLAALPLDTPPDTNVLDTNVVERVLQAMQGLATKDDLDSLRGEVHEVRNKLENVATRDDLRLYLPRETFDARVGSFETRLGRVEENADKLKDAMHAQELASVNDLRHERTELDARTITIMVTAISLIISLAVSPLVYTIFSNFFHK